MLRRGPVASTTSPSQQQQREQPVMFGRLEPLPDPRDPNAPSSSAARALLHRLATDPSIVAIMHKHKCV